MNKRTDERMKRLAEQIVAKESLVGSYGFIDPDFDKPEKDMDYLKLKLECRGML